MEDGILFARVGGEEDLDVVRTKGAANSEFFKFYVATARMQTDKFVKACSLSFSRSKGTASKLILKSSCNTSTTVPVTIRRKLFVGDSANVVFLETPKQSQNDVAKCKAWCEQVRVIVEKISSESYKEDFPKMFGTANKILEYDSNNEGSSDSGSSDESTDSDSGDSTKQLTSKRVRDTSSNDSDRPAKRSNNSSDGPVAKQSNNSGVKRKEASLRKVVKGKGAGKKDVGKEDVGKGKEKGMLMKNPVSRQENDSSSVYDDDIEGSSAKKIKLGRTQGGVTQHGLCRTEINALCRFELRGDGYTMQTVQIPHGCIRLLSQLEGQRPLDGPRVQLIENMIREENGATNVLSVQLFGLDDSMTPTDMVKKISEISKSIHSSGRADSDSSTDILFGASGGQHYLAAVKNILRNNVDGALRCAIQNLEAKIYVFGTLKKVTATFQKCFNL